MAFWSKGLLLFHTVRYLKVKQIINQILVRCRKKENFIKYFKQNMCYTAYNFWVEEIDESKEYVNRFKPEELIENRIALLHEVKKFDKWHFDDVSHLWNFNLHYLEYLVALKAKYNEMKNEKYRIKLNEILEDWYENGSSDVDSNQAYTISLRVINMLLIAELVNDKQKLYDYIYAQYRFLIKHKEAHLLGNHYLENLKAIVVCSIVFGEENIYRKYIKKFTKELCEELTQDGLHFELSLMYHKIVMDDLIRVAIVLKEKEKKEYDIIRQALENMSNALISLEGGVERTLLFNDAGDNVSKSTTDLLAACEKRFGIKARASSNIAGYYRLDEGKTTVIVDCGNLAPAYMPGHSHCDCMSFEMFYDGEPLIVNSGTYQYQGESRKHYRSTGAHNTVVINRHEQSELWGEHRAGRRIKAVKTEKLNNGLIGEYRNYKNEKHRRKISLNDGVFEIIDEAKGDIESYLHLSPKCKYENGAIVWGKKKLKISPINAELRVDDSVYSPEFGKEKKNKCLVFSWSTDEKPHGYRIDLKEINEND